jgi:phenylacetate-CoA ligase
MINSILEKVFYNKPIKKYNLRNILRHLIRNVPYYKSLKLKDFNDLSEYPILTKDIIRNKFEELKSEDLVKRKWWINTSGGSTGEPVKFIQDREYLLCSRSTTYQEKKMLGYRFGDPFIKLWGDEREVLKYSQSLKTKLQNKVKNITFLNSFTMSEENMFKFIDIINIKQPRLIVAYAQSMYELAKFVERNDLKVYGVNAIITSAGTLYPFMRETIQKNFKTRVYNRYGSREVGNIACEEPGIEGLVIASDVLVEVLDKEGRQCNDGVEGEIVVTSLINYAMPLIRYRIGDRGVLNASRYSFPVLEKVSGRGMETFRVQNGKVIPSEYFIHIIGVFYNKKKSWVNKFQVIQKQYNKVVIKIILQGEPLPNDLKQIEFGVKQVMGKECKVNFDFVDEIKSLASGKYLYTICEVKDDF